MNNIGEQIAKLRKRQGMTQEELAATIGVSAQSISKWETGTTMPDILLLPLLANIFDITIDELFGKQAANQGHMAFDDLPEAAYDILLQTMQRAWNSAEVYLDPKEGAKQMSAALTEPGLQTAIYSDAGGAVYANQELGIIFRKPKRNLNELLFSDDAGAALTALANPTVRKILAYQFQNTNLSFTAASVSSKLGIPQPDVEEALEKLVRHALTSYREADIGDGPIGIYTACHEEYLLLVYTMLHLAERIAHHHHAYRGFRGAGHWRY